MGLIRALLSVWTSARSFVLTFWRKVIYGTKVIDVERRTGFPPSPKATREAAEAFKESLQEDDVKALASRYNNGRDCHFFRQRINGSFNVCFFVEFDDHTRWIVRVPITPLLYKPWEKLQSEVSTLMYIRSQTSIPVPVVRAFGQDAVLARDKTQRQMFLISEFITGEPLMPMRLAKADNATQEHFFLQLFDYLAQLRSLEFSKIGSLMHATVTSHSPLVGNIMSFSTNSLGIPLSSFTTAQDYIRSQYTILEKSANSLVADYSESDSQYELFALHTLQKAFDNFAVDSDALNGGPFILHHADLHLCNILVDDDLTIKGLIDWEFANIVPLRLFTPPLWAIHQVPGLDALSYSFFGELYKASQSDDRFKQLFQEWYGTEEFNEAFYFARIIRHPADMTEVFAKHFARKYFGDSVAKAESDFFEQNPDKAAEAKRIATQNSRWTQHLKDSGMYDSENRSP